MPSSTSSSEFTPGAALERPLPATRLGGAALTALLVFAVAIGGWEWHWRAFDSVPSAQNSNGLWAMQRRRIDSGEGDRLVIVGSSRVLFDVQLDVWERFAGSRPIQLAVEGTSPLFALEDLAEDPDFRGRLLVGVTPHVFFTGYAYRSGILRYYQNETPSQRAGQWLSMRLIEPFFAFFDPDFALMAVLKRQDWPVRNGVPLVRDVRKLSVADFDRNTHLWSKVATDAEYREITRSIWADRLTGPPPPGMDSPEALARVVERQIVRAAAAVEKLRARGVEVVFVRPPSNGLFYDQEQQTFPRERSWDVLLSRTAAPGIHFEDYPEMQGLELPEWSHLTRADAVRYTEALYRAVQDLWGPSGQPAPSKE